MGYAYTPAYYSSLQDSITSLCKSILPFSFKKQRLPAAEQKLSKQQSDNLKWQQDSFHQILNLMGLQKEGILPETEVAAFRTKLLETLIVSRPDREQPVILRDKLLFLQELLYAKCISTEEYHASKRPLLQRLAVQGAEIDARDLVVGAASKEGSDEEWSVIDLRDDQCLLNKENSHSKDKSKHAAAAIKHIKGAAAVFGFGLSQKLGKKGEEKSIFDLPATKNQILIDSKLSKDEDGSLVENPFWDNKDCETKSILMSESLTPKSENFGKGNGGGDNKGKVKKKAFLGLFHKEEKGLEEGDSRSAGKPWGFDGSKKRKTGSNVKDETALPIRMKSEGEDYSMGTTSLVHEGPDTKQIKRKLHADGSASDFFIDKVLGDKIKKELSRIQSELSSKNPNLEFSNDQIDAISTKLPVDKADLKKFFPKSWCDQYGDVVLGVVKKEFKEHVGEMSTRAAAREKHAISTTWAKFEDDENCHPNLFQQEKCFSNNPFLEDQNKSKMRNDSGFVHDQNPFWIPGHRSPMLG
ncbi:hypothetical protein Ancab_006751 [Ancistrocladus abbreviatus]